MIKTSSKRKRALTIGLDERAEAPTTNEMRLKMSNNSTTITNSIVS